MKNLEEESYVGGVSIKLIGAEFGNGGIIQFMSPEVAYQACMGVWQRRHYSVSCHLKWHS